MSSSRRDSGARQPAQTGYARDLGILGVIAVVALIIVAQLVRLQVIDGPSLAAQADERHIHASTIAARRGNIYDRNGEVLASSIEVKTIYADPTEVDQPEQLAQALEDVLGKKYKKSYDDYYKLVTKHNRFTYIQRKCSKKLASKLEKALEKANLKGIYYLDDTKRVYPNGKVASQIVGNVNIDNKGIAGLELKYDDVVSGTDGMDATEGGRKGLPIAGANVNRTEAVNGLDIVTSVDIKLQEKMEKSLLKQIKSYKAEGGNAMVVDAKTGEIYASCSYAKKTSGSDKGGYALETGKLASVTDAYEPGSTFKAVTACSILSNSKVTRSTSFSVPSKLKVYDATITDSHSHGTVDMTLQQIIAESSNIGTTLASRKVGKKKLHKTYARFGFGKKPATDFPGVASGQLSAVSEWDPVRFANVTFGQGVTASNAQIAAAFCAIEQNGTLRTPHFLKSVPRDANKNEELTASLTTSSKVVSKATCSEVTKMLRSVVMDGTGKKASISGYKVVGKTGTAQIAENGKYGNGYNVTFAGWLEDSSSDLVCVVTVNKPKTEAGGGPVCGPVFADIMSFAIERYQINPKAH